MKVLGTRWHHTARVDPKAETAQLKSRLVVQGVKTIPFLSLFGPTFTPLPRWDVISLFFVLATRLKLPVYVTDFAKAYLSAQVATGGDTVFIKQPPGFEVPGREDHEYQLKRAAYGLPQSGRAFHLKVKDKLDQLDFVSLSEGVTLYIGRRGGDYVILVIYVDDGLIAGKKALVEDVVGELQEDFDVTFGGTVDGKSFLGRDISHDPQTGSILVSVKSQIEKALKMHGFEDIKPLHMPIQPGIVYVEWDGEAIKPGEYLSAVGSLLFIATTRVDVQYAVGVASRYSSNPGPKHWELVKRIFAYLSVTRDVALEMGLSRSDGSGLVAFVDADHGGDIETRRSTTGVVVQLDGTTILTLSRRQSSVQLSTFQAELNAVVVALGELEWISSVISSLPIGNDAPLHLFNDNLSAVNALLSPTYIELKKQHDLKLKYIREQVEKGFVDLRWVPGVDNVADILTKALPARRIREIGKKLGLVGWPEGKISLSLFFFIVVLLSSPSVRNEILRTAPSTSGVALLAARGNDSPPPSACPACKGMHWLRECDPTAALAELLETDGVEAWISGLAPCPPAPSREITLDSGATHSMCGNPRLFTSLRPCTPSPVGGLSGKNGLKVTGVGSLSVKLTGGRVVKINRALLVPGITVNLVSTSQLYDLHGVTTTFGKDAILSRNGQVIATGSRLTSNLYRLNGALVDPSAAEGAYALLASGSATIELTTWHRRFAHLSLRSIDALARSKHVTGLKVDGSGRSKTSGSHICNVCHVARSSRLPFPRSDSIASTPLELVHSDVLSINVPSLGGRRYVVTFVDDHTRMLWVEPLARKSDVFEAFVRFKAKVENESGRRIQRFRSDNGGEYMSRTFDDMLAEHGIIRESPPPYSPQSNGVAERVNRSIVGGIVSLLAQAGAPKALWAEALQAFVFVKNRSPHAALSGNVPLAVWRNRPARVDMLRTWGCRAWHTVTNGRSKLDDRAIPLIFVGYDGDTAAYRLFDPVTRKTIRSRDTRFVEDEFPLLASRTAESSPAQAIEPADIVVTAARDDPPLGVPPAPVTPAAPPAVTPRAPARHGLEHVTPFTPAPPRPDFARASAPTPVERSDEPPDAKILGCRFVYRRKKDEHGRVTGHKVRLVAQGFSQRPGVDFRDTFAPVAKFTSIRVLLALAARKKMLIHQADVDKAYLHGSLDEELYMRIPEGIDSGEYSGKVLKLDRALGVHHYIALYVDDLLFVSPSLGEITRVKAGLKEEYGIKDLGAAKFILGIQIHQRSDGSLFLSQRAYLEDVLLRLDPNGRRTAPTPMVPNQQLVPAPDDHVPTPDFRRRYLQAVGSLMYAMLGTRVDLAHVVGVLGRHAARPDNTHWAAVLRALQYIRGTLDYGLEYTPDSSPLRGFEAYSDPDWGACPTTSRSTMGYVFLLANGAVSWSSKLQPRVTASLTEAEYLGLSHACKETVYLTQLLGELGFPAEGAAVLYGDNQGANALSKDPQFHNRTRHLRRSLSATTTLSGFARISLPSAGEQVRPSVSF
ncbi:hypothetical protein Rt10032_c01g0004 [Rhodotorula toruloides]|uniref:Integrase catalytic domain-containing protein n=1 Tax=Rhodotorula toruloides TaxID=5286 RepID=A0A511K6R9_RHOTO|nr:hypothetical protein Rt10032_c01g0004 [Rhodotorula toruloides]